MKTSDVGVYKGGAVKAGKMISYEELIEIERITRDYEVFIISDEIYELLNFSKEKHFSCSTQNISCVPRKTFPVFHA